MRCLSCLTTITPEKINGDCDGGEVYPDIRTWDSFTALEEQATRGCELCILFRQYLTDYVLYDALSISTGKIKLFGFGNDLGLKCDVFNGTIVVPVLRDEKLSALTEPLHIGTGVCLPLEQAKIWIQTCFRRHQICCVPSQSLTSVEVSGLELNTLSPEISQLPKRLLDLINDTAMIIDCADYVESGLASISELQQYCTLSHEWDPSAHKYILTKDFELLLGTDEETMPKTFKDAITASRRFGMRFIWIDMLCIVQGDTDEWQTESRKLYGIYQNAICNITICADAGFTALDQHTYSAMPCIVSQTSNGGDMSAECVVLPTSHVSFPHCVSAPDFLSRGWVIQERTLSKRTLHFTEHGLFWECGILKTNAVNEVEGASQTHFASCHSQETTRSLARVRHTAHICPMEWFHLVSKYSFADFTRPGDRLIALSAIAKAVQPIMAGGAYYAGLWEKDLLRGLAWYCNHPRFAARNEFEQIAPTWSWPSVVGGISFAVNGLRAFRFDLAEIVHVSTTPKQETNPLGSISHGILKLSGTIEMRSFYVCRRDDSGRDQTVRWDEEQPICNAERHSEADRFPRCCSSFYACLPIAWSASSLSGASNDFVIGALILAPIGDTQITAGGVLESVNHHYRRIGWGEYHFWNMDYERERTRLSYAKDIRHPTARKYLNRNPQVITLV